MTKKEAEAETDAEPGTEKEDSPKNKKAWLWVVVLVVICLVLAYSGFYLARHTKNDRLSLLIYGLIASGVAWGIYHLAMGIKRGTLKSRGAFFAIAASAILSSMYGYSLELQEEERVFDERMAQKKAEEDKLAAASKAAEMAGGPKVKGGDAGEFETFIAPFINRSALDRTDYQRELDAMGWSKIIDAIRVSQDRSLADSKAMLAKAKDIIAKYRARQLAMGEEIMKGIATLRVSEPSRQTILHSFDAASPNSPEAIGALWDVESKIHAEYEAIFALLAAKKGSWSADTGRILFTSKVDLASFNGHYDTVSTLAQKAESMRQAQREAIDYTFSEKPPEPKAADPNAPAPAGGEAKTGDAKAPDVKSVEVKFGDTAGKGAKK